MEEFLNIVKQSKSILITSHEGPDPDAVGSILSMYFILKQLGFDSLELGLETPHNISNKFLSEIDLIKIGDLKNQILRNDLIIVLDVNRSDRILRSDQTVFENKKVIILDHHLTDTNLTNIFYKRFENTSNCEAIYEMFKDKISLDEKLSKSILLGIYGDTGGFKYSGVGTKTFEIVKTLIDGGANVTEVYREVDKINEKVLKVGGIFLNNFVKKDDYYYSYITESESEKVNATYVEINASKDVFINLILSIEDITWGFILKPKLDGNVSVSFRSKSEKYNVAKFAEQFGGGGHKLASGLTIEKSNVKEVLDEILNKLEKYKW